MAQLDKAIWTCGHLAGAVCKECYRILAARCNEQAAVIETMQEEIDKLQAQLAERWKRP